MKTKLQLLSFCFTLLFMVSCGSDDPKKNAEKAGECKCEMYDLQKQYLNEIQYNLLKTYKKKKRKVKNPDYDPEYTWEKEIDDWDEHVRLVSNRNDLQEEYIELEKTIEEYRMQAYEASDNQDDYDDWIEKFKEELKDYIEDNCEQDSEEQEKDREKYRKKENDYFDEIEEDEDYREVD